MKYTILLLISGMLGGIPINAQQKWSLNECVNYAIQNNLELKKGSIRNEINLEALKQSKRKLFPGISFGTGSGYNFGRSIDPNINDYINTTHMSNSYSMGDFLSIFNGFRLQNQVRYQKIRKQASNYNRLRAIILSKKWMLFANIFKWESPKRKAIN